MPLRRVPSLAVTLEGPGPLWQQVARAVRARIRDGTLRAGARLPSTRTLAADLAVSRNTVAEAYAQLRVEGWIAARRGSGTVVAARVPAPAPAPRTDRGPPRLSRRGARLASPELAYPYDALATSVPAPLEFLYGLPEPGAFPVGTWRRILSRQAGDASVFTFAYGAPEGVPELRATLATHLARTRGLRCDPGQILVVAGVQQALDLTARVLLDEGDRALVEEPHYLGARTALRAAGARLVPVPVDGSGANLAAVDASGCRLACVTPSHQFPIGSVLSLERRLGLLEWADQEDAWILEDDYDSEFRYGARAVPSLKALDRAGRVVYAATFAKSLFPALRMGFLVLPSPLVPVFRSAKWVADWACPTVLQEALCEFLAEGHHDRHLRRLRARYGRRRALLLEALATHLPRAEVTGADAGLHVNVWLDRPVEDVPRIVAGARARGVGVYPNTRYFLGTPARAGLLLGYTLVPDAHVEEGVRQLAEAVRAEAGTRGAG